MKKTSAIFTFVSLILLFLLNGCGTEESAIIGKWTSSYDSITFNEDGSWLSINFENNKETWGRWEVKDELLIMQYGSVPMPTYTRKHLFSISDDALKIKDYKDIVSYPFESS